MTSKQRTGPIVKVGIAQMRVREAPTRMETMALGSCLGIVLFDEENRIGALAHVMHPRRELVKNNANRAKFVDSAIKLMLDRMVRRGASRERIVAKIFGGARMFEDVVGSKGVIQIGEENITAARAELKALGIPIIAERVGGSRGRTILFDVADGSVRIRDAYNREEIH